MLMLGGCGHSPAPEPGGIKRDLPQAPGYVHPVEVPDPKAGENTVEVIARERGGRGEANDIIVCFITWYEGVRASYGKEVADKGADDARRNCETKGKKGKR